MEIPYDNRRILFKRAPVSQRYAAESNLYYFVKNFLRQNEICFTQPIDIWGQRYLNYWKQYRKVTYTNLLTNGRLNAYLADVDRRVQERFERLIEGIKQVQNDS